jgi:NTP pyrophosphatase (non-canonical NTP hydrolase)
MSDKKVPQSVADYTIGEFDRMAELIERQAAEIAALQQAGGGLTFNALRAANAERIGSSKYRICEEKWTPAHWMQATMGELGELANLLKKVDRGDFPFDQVKVEVAKELADVQTYLDILALKLGVDLGQATIDKFNEVSERIGSTVRLNASRDVAPFGLKEFARRAAVEMEKHDFHGFEPVVLAVVEDMLAAPVPRDEWPKEQCPVTGAVTDVDPADLIAAAPTPAPAKPKGCTKPGCFPYCDCGGADDAPDHSATYPIVRQVRAHLHTCACVTGDSGVCDCGAVVDGVSVEVKPAHSADDLKMVRVPREWLSAVSKGDPSLGANALILVAAWAAMAKIRALLAGGAQ